MTPPTVRILVVDNYEPFRRVVSSRLGTRPNFQIVGFALDGGEAVRQARELRPDLVLLEIDLPMLNGIAAAKQIRECTPESKIIFVTHESSDEAMREAFRLGALGYVVKSKAGIELLPAIDAVLGGKIFLGNL
jgi:DNA-binding NarL/FixJ family response regulator